jgi:predicted transcriptional regulator of viral defense system
MKMVIEMESKKTNTKLYEFIKEKYNFSKPILLQDVYASFPEINKNTVRSILKRLNEKEKVIKIKDGVYALPNPNSIMGKPTVYTSDIIKKKYIGDDRLIIGYKSGLNFANKLGLTAQTASVETIISNAVSNRKREIKLNNRRLIIDAPRYKVTNENYRLLQVLDLLNEFERLSEVDLKPASKSILKYISGLRLDEDNVEKIVSTYPLEAQVKFYKIGGHYAIASK